MIKPILEQKYECIANRKPTSSQMVNESWEANFPLMKCWEFSPDQLSYWLVSYNGRWCYLSDYRGWRLLALSYHLISSMASVSGTAAHHPSHSPLPGSGAPTQRLAPTIPQPEPEPARGSEKIDMTTNRRFCCDTSKRERPSERQFQSWPRHEQLRLVLI